MEIYYMCLEDEDEDQNQENKRSTNAMTLKKSVVPKYINSFVYLRSNISPHSPQSSVINNNNNNNFS